MKREFTGRNMAAILIGGFGIVVAVNLTMATLATRGFGGVVVENSYVASQKYNGWLDAAERQERLGWGATVWRGGDGHLEVTTENLPDGATIEADVRRPLGKREDQSYRLTQQGDGLYRSAKALPDGRWIVRLTISGAGETWRTEQQIG